MTSPAAVVVMGVTGCGKTTVGLELAARLHCRFCDGDDFHPPANIEKMSHGIPLNDSDREPWLDALRTAIETELTAGSSVVVGCSALKEIYRARLRPRDPALAGRIVFAWLKLSREAATERLKARPGHFMPASLVDSQFATLEEPASAIVLDATAPVEIIVDEIMAGLAKR